MNKIIKLKQKLALADVNGNWQKKHALQEKLARSTEKVIASIVWDGENTKDVEKFVRNHMRVYKVCDGMHGYYHQRSLMFEPVDTRCVDFCAFVGIPVLYVKNCYGSRLRNKRDPEILESGEKT